MSTMRDRYNPDWIDTVSNSNGGPHNFFSLNRPVFDLRAAIKRVIDNIENRLAYLSITYIRPIRFSSHHGAFTIAISLPFLAIYLLYTIFVQNNGHTLYIAAFSAQVPIIGTLRGLEMSDSSTRAVCGSSNGLQTDVDSRKTQVVVQVPVHPTYNIDCFVKEGETPANGHLRSPIVFSQAQTEAEAEARMQVQLLAFDKKFGQKGGASGEGACTDS
ncbi:hypothetical protein GGI43DRAFT_372238 [Trichoderma evansii]